MDAYLQPYLDSAAYAIGMRSAWLQNVIALESGWDPAAYNATTGAAGLIQFIPRTLKGMGLVSPSLSEQIPATGAVPQDIKEAVANEFFLKYPTAEAQLQGPVVQYLKQYKPYPTEQSAYLAVFYPAYRYASPDTTFPAAVQNANPGIDTVADYVDLVKKKSQTSALVASALPVGAFLAVAALVYYFWKGS